MQSGLLNGEFSLYRQVEAILRDQIADGVFRPGDRLPAEEVLRSQFGISRGTLRQALDALEIDGLVERARGRGTFVRIAPAEDAPRPRMTFQSMIKRARTASIVERQGRHVPPKTVSAALEIDSRVSVPFFIRRSNENESDEGRIGIKRYLAPEFNRLAEDLAFESDFDGALLRLGHVEKGNAWVEAILAEPRFAMLLKVPLGSALMSLWWVDRVDGCPAACTQMLYPGGASALLVRLEETLR